MSNKVDPKFGYGHESGPKWALYYIMAEEPMLEEWREAFYDELMSEDENYRDILEYSIRWHGVRFV